MSIENPTLVHFRHFSSLLTNLPSTSVENALQITPFYAKQTQFPKSPNECKLIYNKGLQKKRRFRSPKKQTQFKPNLPEGKIDAKSVVTKDYEEKCG